MSGKWEQHKVCASLTALHAPAAGRDVTHGELKPTTHAPIFLTHIIVMPTDKPVGQFQPAVTVTGKMRGKQRRLVILGMDTQIPVMLVTLQPIQQLQLTKLK